MEKQHRVFLIGGDDHEVAVFTLFYEDDDCRLRCEYRDKTIVITASDFFQALCDVRAQLASDNLIPFCYGASLDVYPSRMARDMGRGLRAYKMTKGKQAEMVDLVNIFDEGPDIIPASVEAQEQFFRDWLATPRLQSQ
jgi:hypothetical protein